MWCARVTNRFAATIGSTGVFAVFYRIPVPEKKQMSQEMKNTVCGECVA